MDPSIAAFPILLKRRNIELFIIDSLKGMLEEDKGSYDSEIIDAANSFMHVRELVNEADSLYAEGKLVGARKLYLEAIAEISSIYDAFTSLKEIEARETGSLLINYMGQGKKLMEEGNIEEALGQYRRALEVLSAENQRLISSTLDEIHTALKMEEEINLLKKDRVIERLNKEILFQTQELEKSLTEKESIMEEMREEILRKAEEIDRLDSRISETGSQLNKLEAFEKNIQALRGRYSSYREKVEEVLSSEEKNYPAARRMLIDFLNTETAVDLFPGLPQTLEGIDASMMSSMDQESAKLGRESALKGHYVVYKLSVGLKCRRS